MKIANITFDLETLGVNPRAPIVQLAAVHFGARGLPLHKFCKSLRIAADWKSFEPDLSTIRWWLAQDPKVIRSVFKDDDSPTLPQVLKHFSKWVAHLRQETGATEFRFWSHATFDPGILTYAYEVCGIKCPISRREFLDIRTLKALARTSVGAPPSIAHNAFADCLHQAKYIAAALEVLK